MGQGDDTQPVPPAFVLGTTKVSGQLEILWLLT